MMSIASAGIESFDEPVARVNIAGDDLSDFLIAGKTSETNAQSKLKDGLYVFNSEGQCGGSFEPSSDRCNIRLIKGADGENYQLNSETGLLRLDSANTAIVPPGAIRLTGITEPRITGRLRFTLAFRMEALIHSAVLFSMPPSMPSLFMLFLWLLILTMRLIIRQQLSSDYWME